MYKVSSSHSWVSFPDIFSGRCIFPCAITKTIWHSSLTHQTLPTRPAFAWQQGTKKSAKLTFKFNFNFFKNRMNFHFRMVRRIFKFFFFTSVLFSEWPLLKKIWRTLNRSTIKDWRKLFLSRSNHFVVKHLFSCFFFLHFWSDDIKFPSKSCPIKIWCFPVQSHQSIVLLSLIEWGSHKPLLQTYKTCKTYKTWGLWKLCGWFVSVLFVDQIEWNLISRREVASVFVSSCDFCIYCVVSHRYPVQNERHLAECARK